MYTLSTYPNPKIYEQMKSMIKTSFVVQQLRVITYTSAPKNICGKKNYALLGDIQST